MFSGGIGRDQWHKIGLIRITVVLNLFYVVMLSCLTYLTTHYLICLVLPHFSCYLLLAEAKLKTFTLMPLLSNSISNMEWQIHDNP